jgi:hypothetical protein
MRKVRLNEYNARRSPTTSDYRNALKWIRHLAFIHYMGGAFDPEHMRDIAEMAGKALAGEKVPHFPVMKEVARAVEEKAKLWMESDGQPIAIERSSSATWTEQP